MPKKFEIRSSAAEFLISQIEGKEQGGEVYYKDNTVWCTQKVMGMLFDCTADNVGLHLKNIYESEELEEEATAEKISVVRREGNRDVNRILQFYNLDAIISVGYRVNSIRATQLTMEDWAKRIFDKYLGELPFEEKALTGLTLNEVWENIVAIIGGLDAQAEETIVKCYHSLFSLSSQFFNQIIKGRKILSCKLSFLSLFVALSDCICNKLLFLFSSSIISDKLINCHSLDCSKNLFHKNLLLVHPIFNLQALYSFKVLDVACYKGCLTISALCRSSFATVIASADPPKSPLNFFNASSKRELFSCINSVSLGIINLLASHLRSSCESESPCK